LSSGADGSIQGYGVNGWLATVLVIAAAVWSSRVKASSERPAASAVAAEPRGEA